MPSCSKCTPFIFSSGEVTDSCNLRKSFPSVHFILSLLFAAPHGTFPATRKNSIRLSISRTNLSSTSGARAHGWAGVRWLATWQPYVTSVSEFCTTIVIRCRLFVRGRYREDHSSSEGTDQVARTISFSQPLPLIWLPPYDGHWDAWYYFITSIAFLSLVFDFLVLWNARYFNFFFFLLVIFATDCLFLFCR